MKRFKEHRQPLAEALGKKEYLKFVELLKKLVTRGKYKDVQYMGGYSTTGITVGFKDRKDADKFSKVLLKDKKLGPVVGRVAIENTGDPSVVWLNIGALQKGLLS